MRVRYLYLIFALAIASEPAATGDETGQAAGEDAYEAKTESAQQLAARMKAERKRAAQEMQVDPDYIPTGDNDMDPVEAELKREELRTMDMLDKYDLQHIGDLIGEGPQHDGRGPRHHRARGKTAAVQGNQQASLVEKDKKDESKPDAEHGEQDKSKLGAEHGEQDKSKPGAEHGEQDKSKLGAERGEVSEKSPGEGETDAVKVESPEEASGNNREFQAGSGSLPFDGQPIGEDEPTAAKEDSTGGSAIEGFAGKCKECCRGSQKLDLDCGIKNSDPCVFSADCTGYHRCYGAEKGFRQCQWKPNSTVDCHSGPNCMPACKGRWIGENKDSCNLHHPDICDGNFVVRDGIGIQCMVAVAGNPRGSNLCTDLHLCSPGDVTSAAGDKIALDTPLQAV